MKALTLHQPWASLVALGVKTIETRSWATRYRGPLAIHAGATRPPLMHLPSYQQDPDRDHPRFLTIETITAPEHQRPHRQGERVPKWAVTPTLFFPRSGPHGRPRQEGVPATEQGSAVLLPLGAVVATCTLVDVLPMHGPGEVVGPSLYVPGPTSAAHPGGPGTLWLWQVEHDGKEVPYHGWVDITDQLPYGDYRPGRWAWLLADVVALEEPVPTRGRQQLWEWTP